MQDSTQLAYRCPQQPPPNLVTCEAADTALCRSFTEPFPCGKVELIIAMDAWA